MLPWRGKVKKNLLVSNTESYRVLLFAKTIYTLCETLVFLVVRNIAKTADKWA